MARARRRSCSRELLDAGVPAARRLPRLPAAGRGGRRRGARRAREPEIGWHRVELTAEGADDPLLGPLAPSFEAFQWHSYECVPPPGAEVLARSPVCVQAYRVGEPAWGIQFHAEVSAADAAHWIDDYRADPDASGSGSTRRCSVPRPSPAGRPGTSSAGRSARRFLRGAAAAYSSVSGVR